MEKVLQALVGENTRLIRDLALARAERDTAYMMVGLVTTLTLAYAVRKKCAAIEKTEKKAE